MRTEFGSGVTEISKFDELVLPERLALTVPVADCVDDAARLNLARADTRKARERVVVILA